MKSNITKRLVFYFLLVIVVFSIISGILVYFIGRRNLVTNYISDMKSKTEKISVSISQALEYEKKLVLERPQMPGMGKMHGQMMGRGLGSNYISWIKEFLLSDVRLILADNTLENESNMNQGAIVSLSKLNQDEQEIVNAALNSETSSHKSWSNGDNQTEIAVASPIYDSENNLLAAVLVNEKVNFDEAIFKTAMSSLKISMTIGGILVFGLAIFFAKRFISPLNTINKSTKELIAGNYEVRNSINQEDEIGLLANNLDELASRLNLSREESKRLDQMRDDFVSSMSHELKTPVTVIKSYLEALNGGLILKANEVKEYHKILYKESELLERLIFDLMELNILRNSKFEVKKEEINLLNVLKDAIKSQEIKAREKDIKLEAKFADTYIDFEGDYTRLRQLFTTIIDNAIKYSKDASTVSIVQENSEEDLRINIANTGEKIDSETLEHIFEPFYRNKDTKEKGFGLGLAIAHQIAKLHDLDIEIKNVEGKNIFSIIHHKNKKM